MDIPNDLNRLLAKLQQVTRDTSPTAQSRRCDSRPSANEIDCFLSQYDFDSNALIERIEISKDGVFEFYTFAVWNRVTDDLSLLAMQSGQSFPTDEGEYF